MMGCARTAEVEELLWMGHWPAAAGAELQEHVAGCRRCAEMVLVTRAMVGVREAAVREARIEPAALVWWRAQLRRRHEVVERVERPLGVVQMVMLVTTVCVGLGLVWRLGGVSVWGSWLSGDMVAVVRAGVGSFGVWLAVASAVALAMMAGLAVYLTVERK